MSWGFTPYLIEQCFLKNSRGIPVSERNLLIASVRDFAMIAVFLPLGSVMV